MKTTYHLIFRKAGFLPEINLFSTSLHLTSTQSAKPTIFSPQILPVLHEADISDFDYAILLQLGPLVDSSISQVYQHATRSTQHLVHLVTLTPSPRHGEPIRLPVWIFHYLREIELAALYLEKWKGTMVWQQCIS